MAKVIAGDQVLDTSTIYLSKGNLAVLSSTRASAEGVEGSAYVLRGEFTQQVSNDSSSEGTLPPIDPAVFGQCVGFACLAVWAAYFPSGSGFGFDAAVIEGTVESFAVNSGGKQLYRVENVGIPIQLGGWNDLYENIGPWPQQYWPIRRAGELLVGNDRIIGSRYGDRLMGFDGGDQLAGGRGRDVLDGGAGADTATYESSSSGVAVDLATGESVGGDAEGDQLASIENLTGSAHDDILRGSLGDNRLDGGLGADLLSGGPGNDVYVIDQLGDRVVEQRFEGVDTVRSSISHKLDEETEILILLGTRNLIGTGADLDNSMIGNSGRNLLKGEGGNDVLDGGPGRDDLRGGAGNDTYVLEQAAELKSAVPDPGVDTVQSPFSYTLGPEQENITLLGKANCAATGNDGDNRLLGNRKLGRRA